MWPATGLWGSIEFSETWPKTGCMSDGQAFELPTSAHRTTANVSSSSSLLPTPTTGNATGTNERRGGSRSNEKLLPGVVLDFLPTPVTTDAKGARNATATRRPGSQHHGGTTLTDAVTVLPTPVAQPSGNSPEAHLRKKPGRVQVTDLSIIVENGLLESGGKVQAADPPLGSTGAPTLPLFGDGND
ncbi:hypothetical protein A6F58_00630 [Prescottella equi]|nr:hypothetical protein A6F58_00630 [Prescottella equi]